MISASARDIRLRGVLLFFAVFPRLAIAASESPPPLNTPLVSALQMLLGLGVVLVAIACTVWLLRQLTPGQVGTAADLRVVAAVAVGPKERVVLVDVGDQRLVLGVAPGQVTKLTEMPRPETAEVQPAVLPPFVGKLKEMLAQRRSET